MQKEAGNKFQNLQGVEFVNWLAQESNYLKELTEIKSGIGTNYATNGVERWEDYLDRKENRTYQYIPTP